MDSTRDIKSVITFWNAFNGGNINPFMGVFYLNKIWNISNVLKTYKKR